MYPVREHEGSRRGHSFQYMREMWTETQVWVIGPPDTQKARVYHQPPQWKQDSGNTIFSPTTLTIYLAQKQIVGGENMNSQAFDERR